MSISPPGLDASALAALDRFRAEKVDEEAKLIRFAASASASRTGSASTSRSSSRAAVSRPVDKGSPKQQQQPQKKKKKKKEQRELTEEEKKLEEEKAEQALLAEIEAIADLERLNGVAPDSADSMLADISGLSSRLVSAQVSDDDDNDDDQDSNRDTTGTDCVAAPNPDLDVDTFRKTFGESWQLSQFWYSAAFARRLSEHIYELGCRVSSSSGAGAGVGGEDQQARKGDATNAKGWASLTRVGFLCCPTAWVGFVHAYPELAKQAFVFEIDQRFKALSHASYVHYNLYEPLNLPTDRELEGTFDILVADPPFLNVDTQSKVATTAKHLARRPASSPSSPTDQREEPDCKFILITGDSIAPEASKMYTDTPLAKVHDLEVEHHGLANDFGVWQSA
ncbi:hypothetical protein BCV70DRAFT_201869 [Testicularia cyperi]|uniref:Elongation factor methyltransferase 5 n=1 Tax=Testicularia cyperi TaxID=1882483 RepID=A0A317XJW0_9BASI|nr:hypothetical protein BCV70DRAFT_201869 [Testicularia cyperi]